MLAAGPPRRCPHRLDDGRVRPGLRGRARGRRGGHLRLRSADRWVPARRPSIRRARDSTTGSPPHGRPRPAASSGRTGVGASEPARATAVRATEYTISGPGEASSAEDDRGGALGLHRRHGPCSTTSCRRRGVGVARCRVGRRGGARRSTCRRARSPTARACASRRMRPRSGRTSEPRRSSGSGRRSAPTRSSGRRRTRPGRSRSCRCPMTAIVRATARLERPALDRGRPRPPWSARAGPRPSGRRRRGLIGARLRGRRSSASPSRADGGRRAATPVVDRPRRGRAAPCSSSSRRARRRQLPSHPPRRRVPALGGRDDPRGDARRRPSCAARCSTPWREPGRWPCRARHERSSSRSCTCRSTAGTSCRSTSASASGWRAAVLSRRGRGAGGRARVADLAT